MFAIIIKIPLAHPRFEHLMKGQLLLMLMPMTRMKSNTIAEQNPNLLCQAIIYLHFGQSFWVFIKSMLYKRDQLRQFLYIQMIATQQMPSW